MYIKQVIIEGFKSYRDKTIIDEFHKQHNVIVGRNGSGKSNFFFALELILSDEFSHLQPLQRQLLLHSGTGTASKTAYVELTLDNQDSRVPLDQDEIVLRRVIGRKKDTYYFNQKSVRHSKVLDLLKSAGFSLSNPYYIVKQGKVNQTATASDEERLQMFQEVLGIRLYEKIRIESLKILVEDPKNDQIKQLFCTIKKHMTQLQTQKEELQEYRDRTKNRVALEYVLGEMEMQDFKQKLNDLQTRYDQSSNEVRKLKKKLNKCKDRIETVFKEMTETEKDFNILIEERKLLVDEQQRLMDEKYQLDLIIGDFLKEVEADKVLREKTEDGLKTLNVTIRETEEKLTNIVPHYEEIRKCEETYARELVLSEQKRKELCIKSGRIRQFATRDERDRWIQDQLEVLNGILAKAEEHLDHFNQYLQKNTTRLAQLNAELINLGTEAMNQKESTQEYYKQYSELKMKKSNLLTAKNELGRREANIQQNLSLQNKELTKVEDQLLLVVNRAILNGRDSIQKVLKTFSERGEDGISVINGYYGQVVDHLDCDEALYTAIDVTAGNQLFHHIVESNTIGKKILQEMNHQKLPGDVTFIPLDRLMLRTNVTYPKDSDQFALITKLRYQPKFDKVLRHIFGKILVCRNLDVAIKLRHKCRLGCVTLEGDEMTSDGLLIGGYCDTKHSRLPIAKARSNIVEQIKCLENDQKQITNQSHQIDEEIIEIDHTIGTIETKLDEVKSNEENRKIVLRAMRKDIENEEKLRANSENGIATSKSNILAVKTTIENYERELNEELLPQLSTAEQTQLETLSKQIQCLRTEQKNVFTELTRLEEEKTNLEHLLAYDLTRQREDLGSILVNISVESREQRLAIAQNDLIQIQMKIDRSKKDVAHMKQRYDNMLAQVKIQRSELEDLKQQERKIEEDMIEGDDENSDDLITVKNRYKQLISDCEKRIDELGARPSTDIYSRLSKMSRRALLKELKQTNKELEKFTRINQKALDQFMVFSTQYESLQKRLQILNQVPDQIKELFGLMELRKTEIMGFALEEADRRFPAVFKKMVPEGSARLIVKTKDYEEIEVEDTDAEDLTGIGIKVSFTSAEAEMKEMDQLSGGQKTVVALALIFAIQKFDPAPFYLFDEIDQALDPQYRRAVANMIHEFSAEAQFITTTFRPELLDRANKFYGVTIQNKISQVQCISREEARSFVENDQLED